LCRGFEQITMTRPCRRMIRHRSHIRLTDGFTFTARTPRTRRAATPARSSWWTGQH